MLNGHVLLLLNKSKPRTCLQATSRRGSCELPPSSTTSSPDKVPSLAGQPKPPVTVDMHAETGNAATGPLSKLSLSGGGMKHGAAEAAAHGTDTVPRQPSAERRREQEIVDDDFEDVPPVSPAGTAGPAGTGNEHPATAAQQPGSPRQGEADEEEPEPEVRLVWDSSSRERGAASAAQPRPGGASVVHAQAARLKEQGNAHMKSGQFAEAALRYSQALVACSTALRASEDGSSSAQGGAAQPRPQQGAAAAPPVGGEADAAELAAAEAGAADHRFLATLHSNRAHALLKLQRFKEASQGQGWCFVREACFDT